MVLGWSRVAPPLTYCYISRFAFGDEENVPDWFEDEEKKYYKKAMPVTKEEVEEYKQQIREINARPIKKIAEAKAKQKYKVN